MNDKLIFESMLLLLKSTVEVYVHGTLESSNDKVHSALKSGLDDIMDMQFEVFNLMVDNNWYKIKNVDTKTINQTLANLNK